MYSFFAKRGGGVGGVFDFQMREKHSVLPPHPLDFFCFFWYLYLYDVNTFLERLTADNA